MYRKRPIQVEANEIEEKYIVVFTQITKGDQIYFLFNERLI